MVLSLRMLGGKGVNFSIGRCSEDQAGAMGGCAAERPEPEKGGAP